MAAPSDNFHEAARDLKMYQNDMMSQKYQHSP
jgi:hypothetical protein